jgi:hypothetical protein
MGFTNYFFMSLIISGAVYLFYRFVWKKRGQCCGCSSGTCEDKK